MTTRKPWHEVSTQLVDVAMGRTPAELVIRGGQWVNVYTREIIPDTDVAVIAGRIAYCGPDASYCIGPQTQVIDAKGRYLVPGLLDAHMHVESSMLTVTEYVRAVIPHGTTGVFADPHEIANVFGLPGVRLMVDEAQAMPINVYVQMPSCVPSAPGLENPGSCITPADVAEAMTWPGIIGLGEMMNFPAVFGNDRNIHAELTETFKANKTIGGHYASPDLGRPFHAYVAGGPADDHEGTREIDAIERARRGMRPMLRLGSAWYDVEAQVTAITQKGLDPRQFILCTDDVHAGTLVQEGHMDRVLRHAVSLGLDPVIGIQMMTLNTAQHFGVDRDLGGIAPGRYADVVLASDLQNFTAELVIAAGQVVAENGKLLIDLPHRDYPANVQNSVRLGRAVTPDDFHVAAPAHANPTALAHVIGIIENQAPTRHLTARLRVMNGEVLPEATEDVARLALVERHRATGEVVNGFVKGFGFNIPCAVAATVAHDSHHLLVVGTSRDDMALAVNTLAKTGGGVVVIREGKQLALVELPIAGLMSSERAEIVANKSAQMVEAMRACGCELHNAYMQLSLLALVVIPELRISDMGLVDVTQFKHIPVVEAL
ncbi:MAG: adenine deaminase [Anaerolineae bacterium]|nr:adenine deaminase [Anaerolineae bacterium]